MKLKIDGKMIVKTLASDIVRIAIMVAVGAAFVISGLAARTGVQSMSMLAASTLILAWKLKGDAGTFATIAALAEAAAAVALALLFDPRDPAALKLTLAVGAGTWFAVGALLLLRRKEGAAMWLVGASTWLGISMTYSNAGLVSAAGKGAQFLWVPWATAGFAMTMVVIPWLKTRVSPVWQRVAPAWAGTTAKGVVMGFLIAAGVGLVVSQMGTGLVAGATTPSVSACRGCDPSDEILGISIVREERGTVVAIGFAAPPDELTLEVAGGAGVVHLTRGPEGWLASGLRPFTPDDVLIAERDAALVVLLAAPDLQGAVAVSVPDGNRAPASGFVSP